MRTMYLLLLLAMAYPGSAPAQDSTPTEHDEIDQTAWATDHFDLYYECTKISVLVEGLDEDTQQHGFTEAGIESAVEVKLRAVNLFGGKLTAEVIKPVVYVRLGTLPSANVFSVEVTFRRVVFDALTNGYGIVETWERRSVGKPITQSHVSAAISGMVDEFISGYFTANEPFCNDG